MIQCTGILSPFVTSHPVTENILARVKQRTVISLAQTDLTLIVQDGEGKLRHAVSNNKHRASVDARTMLDMELFLSCCYKVSRLPELELVLVLPHPSAVAEDRGQG